MDIKNLFCDSILISPVFYDWTENANWDGEENRGWQQVWPDVSDWSLKELRRWLKNSSAKFPSPDPWGMKRAQLIQALKEDEYGTYDDEELAAMDDDALREAVIVAVQEGGIEGIDAWREKVQDEMREEPDAFVPMMSSFWPLPDFRRGLTPEKAQSILEKSNLPTCIAMVSGSPVLALTGGGMDLTKELAASFIVLGFLPPFELCRLPAMAGFPSGPDDEAVIRACLRTCEVVRTWVDWREKDLNAFLAQCDPKPDVTRESPDAQESAGS
jgi:hypothetical protein